MARRRSSTPRKSIAKAKPAEIPETEAVEESQNVAKKNESFARHPSLTSGPAPIIPENVERRSSTENSKNLEQSGSVVQASVPSRQHSLTASQSQGNFLVPQRASQTSTSQDMARVNEKYHTLKDTPNHLYGLDGALMSSDEEADPDVDVGDSIGESNKTNSWLRSLRHSVPEHWQGVFGGFSACLVFVILVAFAIQVYPSETVSKKTEIDVNSETLRIIMERVDKLSSALQVIAESKGSTADAKPDISEKAVQQIVQDALERYSADKIAMADFALESSGAHIHGSYHSDTYDNGAARVILFGIPLWFDIKPPRVILQPDNTPGNCWAFKGDKGFVVIKLSKLITPTAFSLEHIPKLLSPTGDGRIPSAPKDFTVWGWKDPNGNERVKFGSYVFNNEGNFLQTFEVQHGDGMESIQYVELRVLTNHGNPEYTCLYRFRVHGNPHSNANIPIDNQQH